MGPGTRILISALGLSISSLLALFGWRFTR